VICRDNEGRSTRTPLIIHCRGPGTCPSAAVRSRCEVGDRRKPPLSGGNFARVTSSASGYPLEIDTNQISLSLSLSLSLLHRVCWLMYLVRQKIVLLLLFRSFHVSRKSETRRVLSGHAFGELTGAA